MKTNKHLMISFLMTFACTYNAMAALNFYTNGTIDTATPATSVSAWNSAAVEMTGGTITSLDMFNSSTVTIQTGRITQGISFWNQSQGYVEGGQFDLFFEVHDTAIVDLYDGVFNGWIYATDPSVIRLHAYDVTYDAFGGRWNGGQITGRWLADDSVFTLELLDNLEAGERTYDNITIVPEPTTVALLGLGGLALVRKRRSFY